MSSRFFRNASDSESDDEELMSESGSEDEQPKTKGAKGSDSDASDSDASDDDSDDEKPKDGAAKPRASRFLRGGGDSDSDSEEDVKKVIKSAKDKRVDEMKAVMKKIENAQRIDDWVAISKGEFVLAWAGWKGEMLPALRGRSCGLPPSLQYGATLDGQSYTLSA